MENPNNGQLKLLADKLEGEMHFDALWRSIYATDASIYRKLPLAVAFPKSIYDLKHLIGFANSHKIPLIPRTAGTSLAGQCVGEGIIVDVSKYFTKIVSLDLEAKTVTVQPGMVRDQLNNYLKPYGLFFGPNTSTSNRCMIGGMVGNNSSGTTSIKYGVTRDKVVEMHTILSDGTEAIFSEIDKEEFHRKTKLDTLEGTIYKTLWHELASEEVQQQIKNNFPKPEIHRRNTGYAIDELLKTNVFSQQGENFNLCKLLAGSEGTLAFTTQITLKLDPLPPKETLMVAAHFTSIENCLNAVYPVMQHNLFTCEMMDKTILDCTKQNRQQQENRSFIQDDPEAILMCELRANDITDLHTQKEELLKTLVESGLSYANVVLEALDVNKANELRSAGLGLLGNIVGDKKSAACIEDTAVTVKDLANYIQEFSNLMKGYNQKAIYYAHAGAGELHLRPVLNLKKSEGVQLLRQITHDVAQLVKKYRGSLSGEHGDGIVRSEFIKMMIGEANYHILEKIKSAFDPHHIFNPGKIVNPLPMDQSLRYEADREEPVIKTLFDFSHSQGILREAEKCNGSGDCRKLPEFGGTMCPSYRATRNEKDTTRARANALREFLTNSTQENPFDHQELKEVFDLCLSCKACASECPSSVDVATLKSEFQYQYHKANGASKSESFFAHATKYNKLASKFPKLSNFVLENGSSVVKNYYGIHSKRSLPKISSKTLQKHVQSLVKQAGKNSNKLKKIYLFLDEFIRYNELEIAGDAIELLTKLNYDVQVFQTLESGRSFISKGFLEEAKQLANDNINYLKDKISEETPLLGIEPSAILTFRDEYIKLANNPSEAQNVANHTYLIEEFIQKEIQLGNITPGQFTKAPMTIKFHGHCHQKALSNQLSSFSVLNLPENYTVTIIPSGCCGMAGSFGFEKEHYEISMQVGEQTLFPAIRKTHEEVVISANGTSCRHQIKDGTGKVTKHPITILKDALL